MRSAEAARSGAILRKSRSGFCFSGENALSLRPIGSKEARRVSWIKRESGESPEQSRCCEAPPTARMSQPLIRKDREGLARGVSQKTCHRFFVLTEPVDRTVEDNR